MLKTSGQATITTETELIPVAGDGDCAGTRIPEATVESALNNFEWVQGYVGFRFNKVATATVKLDDTGEEMSFTNRQHGNTTYRFANKLISKDEFQTNPKYREAFLQACDFYPEALERDDMFFYETKSGRVATRRKNEMDNTVIITPKGDQLWPLKKAM